MKRKLYFAILLILLVFASNAVLMAMDLNVKEHTLKNGLKVIIIEDHQLPTFTALIQYNVGSVNESRGITGAAHLLEHLLFKGTKILGTTDYDKEVPIMKELDRLEKELNAEYAKLQTAFGQLDQNKIDELKEKIKTLQEEQRKYIIKNELWTTYEESGGELNAYTSYDVTEYYVTLPSNRLELWAFIESDRMSNPVLREFYSERDVVGEERRMRCDNSPYGKMWEAFAASSFMVCPYRNEIVGLETDISSMTREQVAEFYNKYYSPNNAVAVIAGDVDEKKVMEFMEKYFKNIPARPKPIEIMTTETKQEGEKRIEVEFDAEPELLIGFHGPKFGDTDEYALDIIASILSNGRTSRLYKKLVLEKNMAAYIDTSNYSRRYANQFIVSAAPLAPYTIDDIENEIYKELEILKTQKVSNWELQKIKNQIEAGFIRQISQPKDLASTLALFQNLTGDWKNFDQRAKYNKVTADDIMRVSKKYFVKSNRTVTRLVNTGGQQ